MKAIVCGADGFIGSAVVLNLLSHGYSVVAVDVCDTPKRLDLRKPGLSFYRRTVEDVSSLPQSAVSSVDVFFDFAWSGASGEKRSDYLLQSQNVVTFLRTLSEIQKIHCPKVVFASSIIEYEACQLAYGDGAKPDTHYIYGGAKAACHLIGKPLANSLGLELIWANIASVYGIGDFSGGFINTTLRKILNKEELDFTKGEQYCDFVYIEDVANAFRLLGEKGRANVSYLIGSGAPCSVRTYVEKICATLHPSSVPNFGAVPFSGFLWKPDMFDISKIKNDCGFFPETSFSLGIQETFTWLCNLKK